MNTRDQTDLMHDFLLSEADQKIIKERTRFVLINKNYQMNKDASIATLFATAVPLWVLYNKVNMIALVSWYVGILMVHVCCIVWYIYYRRVNPSMGQIDRWNYVLRVAIFFSTFAYGCLGLLSVSGDPFVQIFILFYLIIVSSAISLGTSSDFISSLIGVGSVLMPFIIWNLLQRSEMEIGIGVVLFCYMFFLVSVSFINYRSAKKYTELSFLNQAAKNALKRAKERTDTYLKKIILNLPEPVYWIDQAGVIQGCNDSEARLFGLQSANDVVGKTVEELAKRRSWGVEALQKTTQKVLQTRRAEITEETIVGSDGQKRTFFSHKAPLLDDQQNIIGVIGTSIDITDRKAMEQELVKAKEAAEAASRAKTAFLENIRHDLRTPLTGIVGFTDLIKSEADKTNNPKIADYANSVQASGQTLLELLNEVLEAMRITSGERPLLKKKFSLQEKLQPVIDLNLAKAQEKHLTLTFDYDETIPPYLMGDPQRIQRIALELITNALNFTEKGRVRMIVKLAKINQDTNDVIIKLIVIDTGAGVPADRKEAIYERFERLTPAYASSYKGLGLGLAIVKQFMDDLGGEIFLRSELQKGSTFTCVIPLKRALLDETVDVDQSSLIPPPKLKSSWLRTEGSATISAELPVGKKTLRVLLVEDNALAARVAKLLLTDLDCAVEIATDGQAAVERARQGDYDLIVMDVGLPKLDGQEATRRIRSWEAEQGKDKHTPIVALTAHADGESKQSCIESGMDAVFSKPLSGEIARDILRAFAAYRLKRKEQPLPQGPAAAPLLTKIIDLELGTSIMGSIEDAKLMLSVLISDSIPEALEKLTQAYEQHNWEAIHYWVHKLQGGAAYGSAPRLKAACFQLETCLDNGEISQRDALYHQLIDEIVALQKEYTKMQLQRDS